VITDPRVNSYLETILWAECGGDGEPLDATYSVDDFADEAIARTELEINALFLWAEPYLEGESETQVAHDFWLTRAKHGAGFWDGGYGTFGDVLTSTAHRFPELSAYVGDDGRIYLA